MIQNDVAVNNAKVLVLGLTFKEDCPDLRNSRVIDVIKEFADLGMEVDVFDPWADPQQAKDAYGIELTYSPQGDTYDAIVLTVAHTEFKSLGTAIRAWAKLSICFSIQRAYCPATLLTAGFSDLSTTAQRHMAKQ
jgi:UDP-N-acetyl-D-galactosamine dehydrogenase